MTCNCEKHLEEFTCSGVDCQVCVLDEENYIENPESKEERYCLNCAMKKAGFTHGGNMVFKRYTLIKYDTNIASLSRE